RERGQPVGLEEPPRLAGRDVQLVQAVRDVGVVVEVAGSLRNAVPPRPVEASVPGRERAEEEGAEGARGVDPVGTLEAAAARGERGEREAVAGGARLVVARGLRALLAELEQPGPGRGVELAAEDEAAVLELLEQLVGRALARRPGEGEPLHAVGVGILG